jgi:hypothetical protein
MITTISTLPQSPSRNDPTTFSDKADALLGAMPTLVTELNSFVNEVNTLSFKTACKAATTTAITLSGTQTIDGQSILAGDRVLVKNQASLAQNGIYTASINAWTRAPDMDTPAEVAGSFVPITYGVANGGKIFYTTFNATGATLGTTDIPWNSLTEASVTGIGTVGVANGGTGIASYAVGDLIYASGTTTLVKLAAAASGNVLKSGTAPSWGKVALASDVSGVLPVANGGTGIASTTGTAGTVVLTNDGNGGWVASTIQGGTISTAGIVQYATDAEIATGTVGSRAVSVTGLRANALVRSSNFVANGTQNSIFTYPPTWAKRITVTMLQLSTSNTNGILLQIGTSSGFINTGYISHNAAINGGTGQYSDINGFLISPIGVSASSTLTGHFILTAMQNNIWVGSGVSMYSQGAGAMQIYAGSNTAPGGLDRIQLIVPTTGTFDSGLVCFMYE